MTRSAPISCPSLGQLSRLLYGWGFWLNWELSACRLVSAICFFRFSLILSPLFLFRTLILGVAQSLNLLEGWMTPCLGSSRSYPCFDTTADFRSHHGAAVLPISTPGFNWTEHLDWKALLSSNCYHSKAQFLSKSCSNLNSYLMSAHVMAEQMNLGHFGKHVGLSPNSSCSTCWNNSGIGSVCERWDLAWTYA